MSIKICQAVSHILVAAFAIMGASVLAMANPNTQLYLVKDGEARSVIVAPRPDAKGVQRAIDELRYHIKQASGAELEVVSEKEANTLPGDWVRIVIGPGELTESLGVKADALAREAFQVKTVGNHLVFVGHDITGSYARPHRARYLMRHSAATMWAVGYYLDHHLGVRWLWPGEAGTHIPHRDTIPLDAIDVLDRPELARRHLRAVTQRPGVDLVGEEIRESIRRDAMQWLARHRMGSRIPERPFGHNFTDWWDKYHEQHLDYFAMSPEGVRELRQARNQRQAVVRAKLCVSNEAVDAQIIDEWRAAGFPRMWGVSPNDGGGFCVCDNCRAMDLPMNHDPDAIWRGRADLTGRYARFWGRLLAKMRDIDPEVKLVTLAYSAYRNPPSPGSSLPDGMVVDIVPTPWQADLWKGWHQAGAEVTLRPNWWHAGAAGAVLPLHQEGEYFKMAYRNGMIGFFFDSLLGYWGLQSPRYYLIARLSARPDLSVDQVIEEYCSAFGPAAPAIRDYIDYWERFTVNAGYSYNAGGVISNPDGGRYLDLVRKHDLVESVLIGSWQVMPYLYTDPVLNKAYSILDRADALAQDSRDSIRQRLSFLRAGLDHLRMTRDVLRLGYPGTRPAGATAGQFKSLSDKLQSLRYDLTVRKVIWGEPIIHREIQKGIPTTESEHISWREEELEGL